MWSSKNCRGGPRWTCTWKGFPGGPGSPLGRQPCQSVLGKEEVELRSPSATPDSTLAAKQPCGEARRVGSQRACTNWLQISGRQRKWHLDPPSRGRQWSQHWRRLRSGLGQFPSSWLAISGGAVRTQSAESVVLLQILVQQKRTTMHVCMYTHTYYN